MPETKYRKKLIEVALPLEVINREAAREKSIRQGSGHPSTLHLWWARRPLATARAVLFAQLVDDPSAWPDRFPSLELQDRERMRLFEIIKSMVPWEATSDDAVFARARREIAQNWARNHPSDKATRILSDDAADDEVGSYLATELPPIHDPFAGGGTIPLEAQRLGLRVIATDLNPVAVLINKALIEIPSLFAGVPPVSVAASRESGQQRGRSPVLKGIKRQWNGAEGLAEDVRYYGQWVRTEAERRIGHHYRPIEISAQLANSRPDLTPLIGERQRVIAYLWARTVASPDPAFAGAHVPLVATYWLCANKGKEIWLEPKTTGHEYSFQVRVGAPSDPKSVDEGTKLGRGGGFRCILSGTPIPLEHIKAEGMAGRLGLKLLAVAVEGKRSRFYLPADPQTEAEAAAAQPQWGPDGDVPSRLTGGTCFGYGLTTWSSLFTSRQLLALTTVSDLALEARELVFEDARTCGMSGDPTPLCHGGKGAVAYADAVLTYLAFARNLLLDDLVSLARWRPTNGMGSLGNAFNRQALPMTWDFPEANPFSGSAGDFATAVRSVSLCLEKLPRQAPAGQVFAADARSISASDARIISTDPPYFDNIGYADLSDFFYVWIRRTLRKVFPDETSLLVVPKKDELIASPFRHGGKDGARDFFHKGIRMALASMASVAATDTPAAIYYAFKQSETQDSGTASTGWETFLDAALTAGFQITGTWPVRTERSGRSLEIGTNALASSIVLVCRRRDAATSTCTRSDFRRALRVELHEAMRALQHGNIAPVDFAQAALGPGMELFSRHARVLEGDGNPMQVRSALQLINEVLDEHLTEQEGELDPDSRFAVTWFENRAFDAGPYGEAETLAKARAVAVEGIADAGILKSGGGRVRLLKRSELPDDWDPMEDTRLTTWEATQHLIKRLEGHGEAAAAELLTKLGSLAGAARDLAYRLYSTCERKGWAEEARVYNGLVVAWPDLERLASRGGDGPTTTTPTQQQLL